MKILRATTPEAMTQVFALRRAVFIEEQGVPEAEEWDARDAQAAHFLCLDQEGRALACARAYEATGHWHIGRVAVAASARGRGLGIAMMRHVMREGAKMGYAQAHLAAQTQALGFYESLGFAALGPEFDDGSGILHRQMTADLTKTDQSVP